ncbi:MAG: GAF domain-containing sensor histidine kinase [Anaerolineae bacterium]|nr:GAF domain-containing sensor histidine kinase [Anaerolineae bacterium]
MVASEAPLRETKKQREQTTEWGVWLVRWGLLACAVAVAWLDAAAESIPTHLLVFFLVAGVYNLIITLVLAFRAFFWQLPMLTLIGDVVMALALLFISGSEESVFFFFPVFPILVGGLRFGWQVGLLTGIIFAAEVGFHTALDLQPTAQAGQVLVPTAYVILYLSAAVVGAVMSKRSLTAGSPDYWKRGSADEIVPHRFRTIYEMASTLSATLNYQRVLEAVLDISRLGFDELGLRMGESVGLVLLYEQDGYLTPVSHRNLVTAMDEKKRIRGLGGIVGEAIASAQAIIGGPPRLDAELSVYRSLEGCRSMICVPLRAGFETYGAVIFASVKRDAYNAEHGELLTIFCNQATIALQNASLYRSLREERDKIVDKEEEARHKLARDLHDGPTQDVAAIAMRLNFARLLVDRDPLRARAELERLEDLAHRTVKEIRSMLFALRPVILETEGLVAALNQYAENFEDDELQIRVEAEGYWDCLQDDVEGVVFAILEEAIKNARKHAQASRISVTLEVTEDLFVARVTDNGRGFEVEEIERNYGTRGSLGMLNLRERAGLIGGTLRVESTVGEGTQVTLLVPLSEDGS